MIINYPQTLFKNPKAGWQHPAISTWGRNNHAIATSDYRYIHYEGGSEELYVIRQDPNEWHNLASEEKYDRVKSAMKKLLPATNVKWAKASKYEVDSYFINQKQEQSQ